MMRDVATYVNNRYVDGEEEFVPTWMIVAQWDRVHPYPHGSDDYEGISEEYLSLVCIITMYIRSSRS